MTCLQRMATHSRSNGALRAQASPLLNPNLLELSIIALPCHHSTWNMPWPCLPDPENIPMSPPIDLARLSPGQALFSKGVPESPCNKLDSRALILSMTDRISITESSTRCLRCAPRAVWNVQWIFSTVSAWTWTILTRQYQEIIPKADRPYAILFQ